MPLAGKERLLLEMSRGKSDTNQICRSLKWHSLARDQKRGKEAQKKREGGEKENLETKKNSTTFYP